MEPRAAVGAYDARTGRTTLYAGSGNVVRQKTELAGILGVAENTVRVIARDVGGNFGTRNAFYPEFALVCWAARRLGRPVKWTCERSESFLSDYQGRDLAVQAELALDADGHFLALRGTNTSNVGAHTVSFVALVKGVQLMSSVYKIPVAHFRARAVLSNTAPTNSYRSAGRPEAMFVIERLIDLAAMQCGFDRVSLRRRNLVPERPRSYVNPLGLTCDGGGYKKAMDAALNLADWQGFSKRKRESRRHGKLRGIGVANYIELTSGIPRERTEITVALNGFVDVVIGTLSSGQGHETSFAQLVTEWLGVPFERVRLITGDTDTVAAGGGSHSGRSMRMAGIVIGNATSDIVAKAKRIVAHIAETDITDVEFKDGRFSSNGRSLDLFEVANAAITRNDLPDELRGPLAAVSDVTFTGGGFPFGTHVCEVEVDPDTGAVALVRYSRARRRRPRGQSADPARPGPWRHRAGRRPGARRGVLLRPVERPAPVRLVHGLHDAARRHAAVVRDRDRRDALAAQSARHPLRRRRRHDTGAGGGGQRHRRCAIRIRGHPYRNAGNAGTGLARDQRRAQTLATAARKDDSMSDDILIKQDGPILRITLNRPDHGNGATDPMALALTEALLKAGETSRLVVLNANGKDFCVGRASMGPVPAVDSGSDRAPSPVGGDLQQLCRVPCRDRSGDRGGARPRRRLRLRHRRRRRHHDRRRERDIPDPGNGARIMPTMVMSALMDRVSRKDLTYLAYSSGDHQRHPRARGRHRQRGRPGCRARQFSSTALCKRIIDTPRHCHRQRQGIPAARLHHGRAERRRLRPQHPCGDQLVEGDVGLAGNSSARPRASGDPIQE